MASDPQDGGGHQCIPPPLAPILGGRSDPESRLVAYIQERLDAVHPLNSEYCCIYRVPERLRKINEEAYTPQFVSIGPFHHGKENLKLQETLKWEYLRSFVDRNSDMNLSQYVKTIKGIEDRIRRCYAEIISAKSDEFVTMMLVDGCFILELFFRRVQGQSLNISRWFFGAILRDFILVENQLPLFVLEELYKLNRVSDDLHIVTHIIRVFFAILFKGAEQEQVSRENSGGKCSQIIKEMLAFVREYCCTSSCSSHGLQILRDNIPNNNGEGSDPALLSSSTLVVEMPETSRKRHLLDFVRDCFIPSSSSSANNTLQLSSGNGNSDKLEHPGQDMTASESVDQILSDDASRVLNCTCQHYPCNWKWNCFIPSSSAVNTSLSGNNKELQLPHNVTALLKAGVKFEVHRRGKCLLDISFKDGVLAIPCLEITDPTETLLRNMIAFEQLHCVGPQYITDYAILLGCLIDTSKDVQLLHDHGIIKNGLGNNEEVSLLFNKLGKEVLTYDNDKLYFYRLFQDLNAHHTFWHAWLADLRQTYFNTPWTAISVFAAAVLIVLTILQTIYTIKSYIKQ